MRYQIVKVSTITISSDSRNPFKVQTIFTDNRKDRDLLFCQRFVQTMNHALSKVIRRFFWGWEKIVETFETR
jgi:hypothetical protein